MAVMAAFEVDEGGGIFPVTTYNCQGARKRVNTGIIDHSTGPELSRASRESWFKQMWEAFFLFQDVAQLILKAIHYNTTFPTSNRLRQVLTLGTFHKTTQKTPKQKLCCFVRRFVLFLL